MPPAREHLRPADRRACSLPATHAVAVYEVEIADGAVSVVLP